MSSSRRIAIRVLPRRTATIAPLFRLLKSYSFFMVHPSYCRRSVAFLAALASLLGGLEPLAKPDCERLGGQLAPGHGERDLLEVGIRRPEAVAVDLHHELGGCGADALVPVHERVVDDERVHERRRLRGEVGIEILTVERHAWPRGGRLEGPAIPQAPAPAKGLYQLAVKGDELARRQGDDHFARAR